MGDLLTIDGSEGEGGGQILRTALALSMVTGRPFEIVSLRAGRKRPGLRPQHLAGVRAAAKICSATVTGDSIGSRTVRFEPGAVRKGTYEFDIGTAGSTSLLLHSLYLPLALASGRTVLRLTGGTHVPFAPTFHYLEGQWAPLLRRIGIEVELQLLRAGYYPEGGGQIRAKVRPAPSIQPLVLEARGRLKSLEGLSAVSNLPRSIGDRQRRRALQRLEEHGLYPGLQSVELPSRGRGTALHLLAAFDGGARACFDALGARGKRAEAVADEACDALLQFLSTGGVIDGHAADQLILPLALAVGPSRLRVPRITSHLLTNAAVIQRFLDCRVAIDGAPDTEGSLTIVPA